MMLRHVALLRNVALQLCSAQQPAVGVCLAEAAAAAAAPAALCSTSVLQLARSMQQQADLPSSSRASLVLHSVTSEEEMCSTRRPLDAPLLPLPPASAPGGLTAPALRRGGPRGGALLVQYPSAPVYYTPRRTPMFGLDGTPRGAVQLPGAVFNTPVRADVMHAVVRWQRARARQGTHKVKSRAEVSGSGRKPWQQKGTGRARHGSRRSPIWVGGGVAHGPVPRSYAYCLNKKVRALRECA
jgi:Ribosomal protein L4/L1 family